VLLGERCDELEKNPLCPHQQWRWAVVVFQGRFLATRQLECSSGAAQSFGATRECTCSMKGS